MTDTNTTETRASPACERCKLPLPDGPDPLRRSPGPVGRRHSGDFQLPSPVRVSETNASTGETEVRFWCSSRCFKLAYAKPTTKPKKGKGRKPTPDLQFHIRPKAA